MPWEQGLLLRESITVNDALIAALSATKNLNGKRGSGIAEGNSTVLDDLYWLRSDRADSRPAK